ncbi:MAG: tetratricopeptide repeat protein [Gammaproteobacteria bacterium]
MRSLCSLAALLALAALASPAPAARKDTGKLPETVVQDLHYGDVLFYFYQDDDFEAITRLNAYEQWGLLSHHSAESQLLLGGLYLSLGLHNEAGERFEKLLTPATPEGVRNRAWFYLAKVWYARGYLDRAEKAITQVQGKLPPALEAEKQHLHANILLRLGRFDEAVALLKNWKGPPDWMAYAQFNVGVALVRENKLSEADPYLTQVGTLETSRPELLALRDRANLAIGFAHLQANDAQAALTALERVRLNGPYSNKALLGTGWANAALGKYQEALGPWMELRDRNLLDAAVQESYLAVPYAFGKLDAAAQSAEYYEQAVTSFDAEGVQLDEAIARIKSGNMLDTLLGDDQDKQYGWFWQLTSLPDAPESRYLYAVLAGHDFQEGLKNYRDLSYLGKTLDRWADSMEAFGNMIDTRERAYAERLPRADALLAEGALDKHQRTRDELDGRLSSIESEGDVAALGSAEERGQWASIQRIEAGLVDAPDNEETAAIRDRLRLVKGVLYFRLNDSFKARLWRERRTIKDLDLALHEAQARWIRVQRARKDVPTNTGEFATRIAALQQRIDALQIRLVDTAQKQNAYLAQLAVRELEGQKDRLATYQIQARFALATMYDRAANADIAGPKEAKPKPKEEVEEEEPGPDQSSSEEPAAEQPSTDPAPASPPTTDFTPSQQKSPPDAALAPLPPADGAASPDALPANESTPPPAPEPKP